MHVAPTQETGTTFNHIDYPKGFKINKYGYMVSYWSSFHNEVAYDSVMHIYITFQLAMNTPIYSMAFKNYKESIHIQQNTYKLQSCNPLKAQFLPDRLLLYTYYWWKCNWITFIQFIYYLRVSAVCSLPYTYVWANRSLVLNNLKKDWLQPHRNTN